MSINFDDLLADYDAAPPQESPAELQLLDACALISACKSGADVDRGLAMLKEAIAQGVQGSAKNAASLRAVDLLARGVDTPEAAVAIEWLAEAGLAESMMQAPSASEMPPMMAACYYGNALVVTKFLELGMPADIQANAPKLKILGGTPFHATVLGYRESRKDDYASVLRSLITYSPDGIDTPDRMGQRPIDLAVRAAAATKDRTLCDAMLSFGVNLSSQGEASAEKLAKAIIKRTGSEELNVLMAANSAKRALREIEADLRSGPRP